MMNTTIEEVEPKDHFDEVSTNSYVSLSDDDKERLINGRNVKLVDVKSKLFSLGANAVNVPNASSQNVGDCNAFCPKNCPVHLNLQGNDSLSSSALKYGSLPDMAANNDAGTSKVTYCVHGKPGGCCATIVTDGRKAPNPITIADEHCHSDRKESTVDKRARRKLITATILCVTFMIAECIGGYLSSSLAIATDAAHLLTDFAGFMISLFAIWIAQRKPTRYMPFGWHRAEVIGALTSVLTIWVVTGVLVYMAVERIINDNYEIEAVIMLITSAIGVVVNIVLGLTLHQHGHTHGNRSIRHVEEAVDAHVADSSQRTNINIRAAFIHVLGDFIQSIGVFIAALIIFFLPTWKIVDPICTFLFSILVLITTFAIIKEAIVVLMEGMPKDVDFNDVLNTFLSIEGVVAVHNLRIWALTLDKTALAAHVVIKPGVSPSDVLKEASKKIHGKYNFFEMTLQIENFQPKMEYCKQCQQYWKKR
ncbi:proton-coupled zinc antiporter SLC30A2-like isoform X2 [Rhodnius prolixus]|uniref:proton-coupled zinc antiporter SLC30A2-like isoform X2 n=1 Tax=Rhodnius prolixus TaxID=13249 RepID=UPI003D187EAC